MSASVRSILEIGFGIIYLLGAGFNFIYTRRHGEKFYTAFANGTWFAPASWFIQNFVIRRPGIFTHTLILFQLFVGIALLSQGQYVGLGLLAGTAFCMYAVFVSNVPGAIANLAMAVLQFYLATVQ
jgi:ABC-type thiamin/hydroxymethylpyrimidine transport system permease subunit